MTHYGRDMQRLDAVWTEDGWRYLLDGESVTASVRTSDRAPYPCIWVDGERLYDVEWTVEGQVRATTPPQSPEADAVFDAFDLTSDRSAGVGGS